MYVKSYGLITVYLIVVVCVYSPVLREEVGVKSALIQILKSMNVSVDLLRFFLTLSIFLLV